MRKVWHHINQLANIIKKEHHCSNNCGYNLLWFLRSKHQVCVSPLMGNRCLTGYFLVKTEAKNEGILGSLFCLLLHHIGRLLPRHAGTYLLVKGRKNWTSPRDFSEPLLQAFLLPCQSRYQEGNKVLVLMFLPFGNGLGSFWHYQSYPGMLPLQAYQPFWPSKQQLMFWFNCTMLHILLLQL